MTNYIDYDTVKTEIEAQWMAVPIVGTVDLSAGHDWSGTNQSFKLTHNNGTQETIILTVNCANVAAIILHVQTVIDVIFTDSEFTVGFSTDYLTLTVATGYSFSLEDVDAFTILGWVDGDYIECPTIKDHDQRETYGHSQLFLRMNPSIAPYATTGNDARDEITTTFSGKLITQKKFNLDLYLDEYRRIINGADKTNAYWHVNSWKYAQEGILFYYNTECSERLWDFA